MDGRPGLLSSGPGPGSAARPREIHLVGVVVVLWVRGLYGLRTRLSARREAFDIVFSVAMLALMILGLLYIFRLENVSRSFLILLFTTQAVVLILSRAVLRFAFGKLRDRGLGARHMLLTGSSDAARAFADLLVRHGALGLHPIGFLRGRMTGSSKGPGRSGRDSGGSMTSRRSSTRPSSTRSRSASRWPTGR